MNKTLFRQVTMLTGDDLQVQNGDLLIEDGIIKKIGTVSAAEAEDAVEFARGEHYVLVPGYINTHTHVAMSVLRDYGGDMPLDVWLNQYIWPAEAKLTDDDVYWGSCLGMLEMIASGTTCLVDMYDHCDAIAEAISDGGMRAILSRGSVGMNDPEGRGIAENDAVYARWHGAEDDRIRVWYGPHAPNTCPGDYIQEMAQHARERGTGVHIHVAETKGEWEWCQSTHGMTPVGWLESLGVLDVPTLAAHSVWLDDADIAIYAKHGVAAAHNPISNLKLASGVCRVEDLQRAGVTVGLGTDGSSSNNIMSMHRELQVAALIHKIRNYDAQVVGARDALKLATIEGAKAIRWQDAIGSIAEGKKADLTLYKLDAPWNVPHHDVVSNLAYAAQQSDIDSVFVQGECLYKHGDYTTLDKERILAEAETRAKRLIQ
ncbi:MAG: amidohydrolase [Peptococcaceae bacterium]|nr:amidohydrolase [Peptococcaceae bacterium]